MDVESKTEVSSRERRKSEQVAAILKREEGNKLTRKVLHVTVD